MRSKERKQSKSKQRQRRKVRGSGNEQKEITTPRHKPKTNNSLQASYTVRSQLRMNCWLTYITLLDPELCCFSLQICIDVPDSGKTWFTMNQKIFGGPNLARRLNCALWNGLHDRPDTSRTPDLSGIDTYLHIFFHSFWVSASLTFIFCLLYRFVVLTFNAKQTAA